MDVSLLIRLIDQFSAPAKTIAGKLKAIGDTAKEMGSAFGQSVREGFSVDNVEKASANAEQALSKARARLLGAFGMAMTLGAPVVQAAQFDQSMRGLDKVLDVSGERLANLRKFALDTSAEVPIAARDLVDLMSEAAQGGVPQEELEAFSLYVAKAAVAFDMAGGEIGDRFAKLRNVYKLNQQGIEELGALMRGDIVRQHGVRELVRDLVTELRADLPVDLRAFAGDDEAALEAFIDRLLADGSDEILARLTSASAEPA